MTLAREQSLIDGQDFAVLSSYAAIALAFQDDDFAATLPEGQRKIVDTLRSSVGSVETGLGFPLAARPFKPANLLSLPPDVAGCFAARQWYATVVFRLSDPRETRLALCLAWLIHHDPELSTAWNGLTGLNDDLLGSAMGGSVPAYLDILKNLTPSEIAAHLDTLRDALEKTVPESEVNDQLLLADDATHFGAVSQGFRLLPPRRLPRWDDAANSTALLRKAFSAPLPDSIFGQSLRLLTQLETPLPDSVPPALRTVAWSDLQLWTALGGWAELRHIGTPIANANTAPLDASEKPNGIVAPYPKFFAGLSEVSRRAAVLLGSAGAGQNFDRLMRDFATVCDRLAVLARKQLDGVELIPADAKWIRNYGVALQKFCPENDPSDEGDFPIVSRLSSDPAQDPAPYAWVAQPQALYVILPSHGRLCLFCGAVLSYRQCVRTEETLAPQNDAPPAPDFTRSFRAEKTVTDLLADLDAENGGRDGFGDEQTTLKQLDARLTDADLPELIRSLAEMDEPPPGGTSAIAGLIAKMNWKPYQSSLLELMETNDAAIQPVATILTQQPEALDPAWLCANFDRQPPLIRALYCRLLGRHGPASPTAAILDRAALDPDEDVRWSGIMALQELRLTNDQSVAALAHCVSDTNEYVAAAAAWALGKLGVTTAAPLLLTNLQMRLAAPSPPENHSRSQSEMFQRLRWLAEDPDEAEERAVWTGRQRFLDFESRPREGSVVNSLAQALGALRYEPAVEPLFDLVDSDYAPSVVKALDNLVPERIRRKLLDTACDQRKKPEDRDRALQLLLQTSPSKDAAQRLAPLLDETVEVRMDSPRGPMARQFGWRLCDRAVEVIGHFLDKPTTRPRPSPIRSNETTPEQARQWLQEAAEN
jgi:hypothetical protein